MYENTMTLAEIAEALSSEHMEETSTAMGRSAKPIEAILFWLETRRSKERSDDETYPLFDDWGEE